jgi:hypothetical protein
MMFNFLKKKNKLPAPQVKQKVYNVVTCDYKNVCGINKSQCEYCSLNLTGRDADAAKGFYSKSVADRKKSLLRKAMRDATR